MRLVGAASIVFALALTFAVAGISPAVTANQTAGRSNESERHDRDEKDDGRQGNQAPHDVAGHGGGP